MEVSFEYWNKLADQTILISSLLAGFSIAVIANLLVSELNTRLSKSIMIASTLAASLLLFTVFAMTKLMLMTTSGYPFPVTSQDLIFPRTAGAISFYLGIMSLITVISLAGWTKTKKMGRFTTAVGILTFLLIVIMTS